MSKLDYTRGYNRGLRRAVVVLLGEQCEYPGCAFSSSRLCDVLEVAHANGDGAAHRRALHMRRGSDCTYWLDILRDLRSGNWSRYLLLCPTHHRLTDLGVDELADIKGLNPEDIP